MLEIGRDAAAGGPRTAGARRPVSTSGLLRGPRTWERIRSEDSAQSLAWSDMRWGLRRAELPPPFGGSLAVGPGNPHTQEPGAGGTRLCLHPGPNVL